MIEGAPEGIPASLDVRLLDRAAFDRLERAAGSKDRRALAEMCEVAAGRMREAGFRRWPGRMSRIGWSEGTPRLMDSLRERLLARGRIDFVDEVFYLYESLVAAYAMPFFQA